MHTLFLEKRGVFLLALTSWVAALTTLPILAQTNSNLTTRSTNAPALKAVVATSTRTEAAPFDVPASIDVVGGNQMRDGKLQINLSESLGGVRGLMVQNRQNYAHDLQLSIRGFGARSTFGIRGERLYVDGHSGDHARRAETKARISTSGRPNASATGALGSVLFIGFENATVICHGA